MNDHFLLSRLHEFDFDSQVAVTVMGEQFSIEVAELGEDLIVGRTEGGRRRHGDSISRKCCESERWVAPRLKAKTNFIFNTGRITAFVFRGQY